MGRGDSLCGPRRHSSMATLLLKTLYCIQTAGGALSLPLGLRRSPDQKDIFLRNGTGAQGDVKMSGVPSAINSCPVDFRTASLDLRQMKKESCPASCRTGLRTSGAGVLSEENGGLHFAACSLIPSFHAVKVDGLILWSEAGGWAVYEKPLCRWALSGLSEAAFCRRYAVSRPGGWVVPLLFFCQPSGLSERGAWGISCAIRWYGPAQSDKSRFSN
jgi:hypothetical protein